jgi:hypothetical protein
MNNVRFPFWIVGSPHSEIIHSRQDGLKEVHAFTSGDKVTGYLAGRTAGSWKLSLVNNRRELELTIAKTHQYGSVTVCFDPHPDGSGGVPIDIVHLLDMCDSEAT